MKTVTLQHLPYKTLDERRETDAHLSFIKTYLGNDYRVKLRARGARKKHALKDGLAHAVMIKSYRLNTRKE